MFKQLKKFKTEVFYMFINDIEKNDELKERIKHNIVKAKNDPENYSFIYISPEICVITSPDIPGGKIIKGFFTIKGNDQNFTYVIDDSKLIGNEPVSSNETQQENDDPNSYSLQRYAFMSVDKKNRINVALSSKSDILYGLLDSDGMYDDFSITGIFLTEDALVVLGVDPQTHKYEIIPVYEFDNDIHALYNIITSEMIDAERGDHNE